MPCWPWAPRFHAPCLALPLLLLALALWTAAASRWGLERARQGFPSRRIRLVCWPPLLLTLALAWATLRVLAPSDRTFITRLHFPEGREQLVIVRTGPQGILPSARLWILERKGPLSWRKVQSEIVEEVDCGRAPDIVQLNDLSGDGVPELLIAFCWGSGGTCYRIWKCSASGHWTMASEDLANPIWCPGQRCVITWSRMGCGNFGADRRIWQDDRLVTVEEVSQCELFSQRKEGYRLRVSRQQDGEMRLFREWFSPTPHAWADPSWPSWDPPDAMITLASSDRLQP